MCEGRGFEIGIKWPLEVVMSKSMLHCEVNGRFSVMVEFQKCFSYGGVSESVSVVVEFQKCFSYDFRSSGMHGSFIIC